MIRVDWLHLPLSRALTLTLALALALSLALTPNLRTTQAEKVALELAAMLGEEADGDELSSDDEA